MLRVISWASSYLDWVLAYFTPDWLTSNSSVRDLPISAQGSEEPKPQSETLNDLLIAMLNSVGQGFLLFDEHARIMPTYSSAVEKLFGVSPENSTLWELLCLDTREAEADQLWLELLFSGEHEFDSISFLGPKTCTNSEGRIIRLQYFPYIKEGKLARVVLVASDISEEVRAKERASTDRAHANMIIKMARNSSAFIRFDLALNGFWLTLEKLLDQPQEVIQMKRIMHTIKGTAATLSLAEIAAHAHQAEELMNSLNSEDLPSRSFAKVQIIKELRKLRAAQRDMNTEFVSLTGQQSSLKDRFKRIPISQLKELSRSLSTLGADIKFIDNFERNFVLEPLGEFIRIYDEMTQELATKQDKTLNPLQIIGGEMLVDVEPLLPLLDSLVHVFRNAVDHGIEIPSARQDLGKNLAGQITTQIERVQKNNLNCIQLIISDDGDGIDLERVRGKLKSLGRLESAELPDELLLQMIFEPEFSTASTVSSISGRGIGLDAILTEAKNLGGTARAESVPHVGTKIIIVIPETQTVQLKAIA